MKNALIIFILISALPIMAQEQINKPNKSQFDSELLKCIEDWSKIKIGMKRIDLMKLFTEEGGISTRTSRVYVHKVYEMVKIDVEFSDNYDSTNEEDDIIKKISRPYLQLPIND